jgi:Zn-dependent protease
MLAIFNLIPLPPLDGSKILSILLPSPLAQGYERFRASFERLGIFGGVFILLILFYFFSPLFLSVLQMLFGLITGLNL